MSDRAADTVFALASGAGRAGVAVIRISGPRAAEAAQRLAGRHLEPRRAELCRLHHPVTGDLLDQGLCLVFPEPRSFTGETVAELHVHGGRAVVGAVADALLALPGLRPAEPGEFTRRAFRAGKLDLTQVEALADLVAAETEAQRRQALRQRDGGLSLLVAGWRDILVRCLARLEATLDFPDEDLPAGIEAEVAAQLQEVESALVQVLAAGQSGERLRDGLSVVILGAPNAGKSSLLNALAGRDVAIVSATAGTTRDIIEVHLDLRGFPVVLADTAGLRESIDSVEAEGVRRALARAQSADVRLVVVDGSPDAAESPDSIRLVNDASVVVVSKADLPGSRRIVPGISVPVLPVSTRTGEGLDALLGHLATVAEAALGGSGAVALTRARHRAAIGDCQGAVRRALAQADMVLRAEDLRLALRALGRVVGQVDVEDVLDLIFREFCIGK
ncbi:MAG: tRNA uridine-5-carboxymethylaminomethyl(34) synthesis GTPase MnmE [Alphaproteobacteria bacterium]|nr:tRNA uridine-5-carboxymethylaminomethyl(34) synthesis GTPase MnmE [Alphaproteobacteria bacterium]